MCRPGCFAKIAEHWTPHLDGKRSIPDALSALVVAFRDNLTSLPDVRCGGAGP